MQSLACRVGKLDNEAPNLSCLELMWILSDWNRDVDNCDVLHFISQTMETE